MNKHRLKPPKGFKVSLNPRLSKAQCIEEYNKLGGLFEAANRRITKQSEIIEDLNLQLKAARGN